MCGIAGIIDLKGTPINVDLLIKMNYKIRHRGPDDDGYLFVQQQTGQHLVLSGSDSLPEVCNAYPLISEQQQYIVGNIGLTHRRYSIIDLTAGGHQPFFDTARTCCVVFNGEIYNYLEVRDELQHMGHAFRTASDTEVIVEAYKVWGTDCFAHFNGMWALALYDFKRQILIISRDRMGKKPLYWTKSNDRIYFASEIKALFEVPEIAGTKAVNEAAIFPYLACGLRDLNNRTFFEGIYTLPAASWAILNKDFPINIHQYWQLSTVRLLESEISIEEAAARIREILADAIRIRLRADVPWSIELSGGMDSSALVALAAQFSQKPLITYTVRFPEKEWNEEPFARSVASRYKTDYRVIDSPLENFWPEILPFTYLEEEPYHAPNLHTNQIVRRVMRSEGIKMLLNGAGGDEIFAGYDIYYPALQIENILRGRFGSYKSNMLHWTEAGLVHASLLPLAYLVRQSSRLALKFFGIKSSKYIINIANSNTQCLKALTLSNRLFNDFVNTKIPYWLRSGDKTHMGVPIEARNPFLDYRLVELIFSLPITYLIRYGWHKWILRKALEDILPPNVVWRKKKMGFPFPFVRFFDNGKEFIDIILNQAYNPYLDFSQKDRFKNNWRTISFILWYECFINENHNLFHQITKRATQISQIVDYGYMPAFLNSCRW